MRFASGLAAAATIVAASFAATVPATAAMAAPHPAQVRPVASPAVAGAQLWAKTWSKTDLVATAYDVAVSPDSSTVYVTGTATTFPLARGVGVTIAYNAATGAKIWEKVYNPKPSSSTFDSIFYSVAVSPDGSTVYVYGESGGEYSPYKTLVLAYSAATGATLWKATGTADGTPSAGSMAVAPNGSALVITGTTYTQALNPATGASLWNVANPAGAEEADMTFSADSSAVYLSGTVEGSSVVGYIASLDAATGATNWQSGFTGPSDSSTELYYLAVSPDGSTIYATGDNTSSTTYNILNVAVDAATGDSDWTQTGASRTIPHALAVDPDGSAVFVTMSVQRAGRHDFTHTVTAALDPSTGATVWQETHSAPRGTAKTVVALPQAIVASPDGSAVYVTGSQTESTTNAERNGIFTIAYDASSGASLWTSTNTKSFTEESNALAVSPDGSAVFPVGSTQANPTGGTAHFDLLAVAYSTS